MARLAVFALTVAMLASSGTPGMVFYLCQMDGQVHTSCCCMSRDDGGEACLTIVGECCCNVELTETEQVPAKLDNLAQRLDMPTFSVVVTPCLALQAREHGLAQPLTGRPPPGEDDPPTYLLHCSYLI